MFAGSKQVKNLRSSLIILVQARTKYPRVIDIVEAQKKEAGQGGRIIRTDFREDMGMEPGLEGRVEFV